MGRLDNKKHYQENKEAYKKRAIKSQNIRRYGVTPEDWEQMFETQGGRCKICKKHQSELSRVFHIDHCHSTGKVRGLLCMNCNTGLGNFKDNPVLLSSALNYLMETQVV